MSAYMIVHTTIKDADKFQTYAGSAPATLVPFGGEFIMRGSVADVFAGTHDHQNAVVIKFPDMASLNDWYASDTYQTLIPNRDEAADMVFVAYDEPRPQK